MRIRKAAKEDLRACVAIDPSFVTDYVWQIKERTRNDETILTFRPARLPRPIRVEYPRSLTNLEKDLERRECFLVIEEEGEESEILGYLDLIISNQGQTGWVKHLVVAEPLRRHGLGSQLLSAGLFWCEYQHLRWVMAECQTKNYPAIRLYQKNNLSFCGYNDMYYANSDIALFFARDLFK